MPTTPDTIAASIIEAAAAGFRGRLIARGQARAIIWRDGVLPPDAPEFAPQLSYDLNSYGYSLLGLGLRLRELQGDTTQARMAFEQAATALEAVIAKGDPGDADRDFHFVMAQKGIPLAFAQDLIVLKVLTRWAARCVLDYEQARLKSTETSQGETLISDGAMVAAATPIYT